MSMINQQVIEILFLVVMGVIGTVGRWSIQVIRGGGQPTTLLNAGAELFIGGLAGVIGSGVNVENWGSAIGFGYAGADAVENLLKKPVTNLVNKVRNN